MAKAKKKTKLKRKSAIYCSVLKVPKAKKKEIKIPNPFENALKDQQMDEYTAAQPWIDDAMDVGQWLEYHWDVIQSSLRYQSVLITLKEAQLNE